MRGKVIGNEVLNFVRASEALLSPLILNRELTEDECELIVGYIDCLADPKNPWNRPRLPKAS
jgi:hypothetical protein